MSRNYSFEGNSSSQEKGEGLFGDEAEVPWLNFKEDQNEVFLMVNNNGGSELECESTQLLTHDTSLEKLYDEYLGLLKIDDRDLETKQRLYGSNGLKFSVAFLSVWLYGYYNSLYVHFHKSM